MHRGNVIRPSIGFLLGVALMYVISILAGESIGQPGGPVGDFSLGLIQLIALFFPALIILLQVLLEYSYQKGQQPGKSGGVGPLRREEYRVSVLLMGGMSGVFLILGLGILFFSLELTPALSRASFLIFMGVTIPIAGLILFTYYEIRDI